MPNRLFPFRSEAGEAAQSLYLAVVEQARRSEFYAGMGVPDSVDGRFEMIVLHAFLVLRRLKRAGARGERLAQALFDAMFADMDRNLREMGVGDLSVGRRVKDMAKAFYGRAAAYDAALASDEDALTAALGRNLYGTTEPEPGQLTTMAGYVRRQAAALADQDIAELLAGRVRYGEPRD